MSRLAMILVVASLVSALPAAAAVVVCPAEADTYIMHGGMYYGYPDRTCARATNWVGVDVFFRFDLSELEEQGWTADDVACAVFHVYTGQGTGMMAQPMAPKGTTQQAQVLALRTWDDQVHPYGLTYWTEAPRGAYADGYIDGTVQSQSGYPNIYDPGDVGGVDPYHYEDWGLNPGDPWSWMIHDGGPGVPADWDGDPANLNPDGWVEVNLTEFVKAWLRPEDDPDHIDNNGIRIHDLGGWSGSPDPEFGEDYGWGWYFMTKDVDGYQASDHPTHPGADYVPYVQVVLDASANTTGWSSVRTHGPAGDLAIELDASASGSDVVSEARTGGVQKIVVNFDIDVTACYIEGVEAEDLTNGGTIAATNEALTNGGTRLQIEFAGGLPDQACYKIDLAGNILSLTGDTDCMVRALVGDTNDSGTVNPIDMSQTKSMNAADPAIPGNARFDVNVGGTINIIDMSLVKSLNGSSASCP